MLNNNIYNEEHIVNRCLIFLSFQSVGTVLTCMAVGGRGRM
jgi:hypothetical protein